MVDTRSVYRVLVGKPDGKRPLGKSRHRWEDDMTVDLQEMRLGGMDWIDLAQDREKWRADLNVVMNLRVPYNVGKFLTSLGLVSLSGRTLLHVVSQLVWRVFSEYFSCPCQYHSPDAPYSFIHQSPTLHNFSN
jgi:hypothetical protein